MLKNQSYHIEVAKGDIFYGAEHKTWAGFGQLAMKKIEAIMIEGIFFMFSGAIILYFIFFKCLNM